MRKQVKCKEKNVNYNYAITPKFIPLDRGELTKKEMMKLNESYAKDLKTAINYLSSSQAYEPEAAAMIGRLTVKLINITGPLK